MFPETTRMVQKLDPGVFEAGIAQLSNIYGFKCGYEMFGRSNIWGILTQPGIKLIG